MNTFIEEARFARVAAVWRPDVYRTGKRKGDPCMRDQKDRARDMTPDEKVKHRPDLLYDLSDQMQRRILGDFYEDRGHEGDQARAEEQRRMARRQDVHDAIVASIRQLTTITPVQRVGLHLEPIGPHARPDYLGDHLPVRFLREETRRRLPDLSDDEFAEQLARTCRRNLATVNVPSTPGSQVFSRQYVLPGQAGRPVNPAFRQAVVDRPDAYLDVGGHHWARSHFSPVGIVRDAIHRHLMADPDTGAAEIIRAVREELPGVSSVQVLHVLAGNGTGSLTDHEGYSKPWRGSKRGEQPHSWRIKDGIPAPLGKTADRAE